MPNTPTHPKKSRKFKDDHPYVDHYALQCIEEGKRRQPRKRGREGGGKGGKKGGEGVKEGGKEGREEADLEAAAQKEIDEANQQAAENVDEIEEDADSPLVAARQSLKETEVEVEDILKPKEARIDYEDVPARGVDVGPKGWYDPADDELEKFGFDVYPEVVEAAKQALALRAERKKALAEDPEYIKALEKKVEEKKKRAEELKKKKEEEASVPATAEQKVKAPEDPTEKVQRLGLDEVQKITYESQIEILRERNLRLQADYDLVLAENAKLKAQLQQSVPKPPSPPTVPIASRNRKEHEAEVKRNDKERLAAARLAKKQNSDGETVKGYVSSLSGNKTGKDPKASQEAENAVANKMEREPKLLHQVYPREGHTNEHIRSYAVYLIREKVITQKFVAWSLSLDEDTVTDWVRAGIENQGRKEREYTELCIRDKLVLILRPEMEQWRKDHPNSVWPLAAIFKAVKKATEERVMNASRWTIARAMAQMGAVTIHAKIVRPLSNVNRIKRLLFARFHYNNFLNHKKEYEKKFNKGKEITKESKELWEKMVTEFMMYIIFTDEKIFTVDGGLRIGYVMPGDQATVLRKGRYTQGQMLWVGICIDPKMNIIGPYWIKGTMNTDVYAALLNKVFRDYPGIEKKVFQQDNAPCHHRHNVIPRLLAHHNLEWHRIPRFISWWCPQSPDLSPIENYFSWVDQVKRETAWSMDLTKMKAIIENIFMFTDPDTGNEDSEFETRARGVLRNCLLSWPDRLEACIKAEGGWTKY